MDDELNKNDGMDDLEAQLASLGMFDDEDGDTDPFAGFDFGDDDDDMLSSAAAPAPTAMSMDDGEMDLDKQLEMLLMADETADEGFEVKDISAAMPTQTVYDPEVDGMGSVQYVKGTFKKDEEARKKLFADITPGKMVATLVIGVMLIAIGAATAIYAHSVVQKQNALAAAVEHFRPVEIPQNVSNNTNIIFINERAVLGEQPLTLLQIHAAYSGTFFHFEEHFNPDDYYILLYNQARHLYSYTTFNISAAEDEGTVLQFGPLTRNTLFLTLQLQCKETHEYVRFNYRLTAPAVHDAPVFINRPHPAMSDGRLTVRYATFDSASSVIHFSYMPHQQGAGLRINADSDVPFVSLDEIGHRITPYTNEDATVYFDRFGIIMGVATFAPVFSLESTVNVVFNGLTYFFPSPTVEVTPQQLFANALLDSDEQEVFEVPTGEFSLMLEGMDQQGLYVVLTLHGLDDSRRRRITTPDMILRVALEDGGFIDMSGTVRASERGSDVLFNLYPHISRIRDVDISNYSLIIRSVEYDVPSVSVPIEVTRFYNRPRERRYDAELAITNAFNGLLSHRSGEFSPEGFVSLSPALRTSDALINGIFAPREFRGRAMHSVTVTLGDLISNYHYLAVVETLWVAGEGEELQYINETFHITAQSTDLVWSIVEIIRQ
jgi:hypothetical protein